MMKQSRRELRLKRGDWPVIVEEVSAGFHAVCKEFDLSGQLASGVIGVMEDVATQ